MHGHASNIADLIKIDLDIIESHVTVAVDVQHELEHASIARPACDTPKGLNQFNKIRPRTATVLSGLAGLGT